MAMKTLQTLTLGFFVATMMALGAGPAQAQTTANGPYYATPSWDQTLACTTAATCPRFIVLSNFSSQDPQDQLTGRNQNQAVLDRETGLVWERSPDTTLRTWQDAQTHCNQATVGGRKGWRLPTVQELASLIDPSVAFPGPTLPPGHPFSNVQTDSASSMPRGYKSATSHHSVGSWAVFFRNGFVGNHAFNETDFVWCVRGGQGVDLQ
jgi:hypothetical protein